MYKWVNKKKWQPRTQGQNDLIHVCKGWCQKECCKQTPDIMCWGGGGGGGLGRMRTFEKNK